MQPKFKTSEHREIVFWALKVADPDLQIRKGGGGWAVIQILR